jgi:hypothetical protein
MTGVKNSVFGEPLYLGVGTLISERHREGSWRQMTAVSGERQVGRWEERRSWQFKERI